MVQIMDTTDDAEQTQQSVLYIYGLGFFFGAFVLITLCYVYYVCRRRLHSRLPPQSNVDNINIDGNHHFLRISRGLDDDHLATFPTFVYSEAMMTQTGSAGANGARSCTICLVDYKAADVIRLLPECGHLFHLKCVDTWLKVHPTCPVCRNSPLADRDGPIVNST